MRRSARPGRRQPEIGTLPKHQNTDATNKWRMTVGAANIPAGSTLFTVNYSSAYSKNGYPFAPVTLLTDGAKFSPIGQTPNQVSIQNNVALAAGTDYDLGIFTAAG